jgi:hypothetical protein
MALIRIPYKKGTRVVYLGKERIITDFSKFENTYKYKLDDLSFRVEHSCLTVLDGKVRVSKFNN